MDMQTRLYLIMDRQTNNVETDDCQPQISKLFKCLNFLVVMHYFILIPLIIMSVIFVAVTNKTQLSLTEIGELASSLNKNFGWILNHTKTL